MENLPWLIKEESGYLFFFPQDVKLHQIVQEKCQNSIYF